MLMIRRLTRMPYKYQVAAVFIFGLFMDIMDSTVVNVALPQLSHDFHASTGAVEWTVTGYLLSLAVFIPAAGFISDRWGTKRAFMAAMLIFTICSALCGQAHSLAELVTFRFLQGVGGGMMTPVGTAMLSREFPGVERAKASAIISVPVIFAPLMGPVLGGYLVQFQSWRWIFYINLPIGLVGLVMAWRLLREHREPEAQQGFDLIGLILGGVGSAALLYAFAEAANDGWGSSRVILFGVIGAAAMAIFVVTELTVRHPILDLRLFKLSLFSNGNAMLAWSFASVSGVIFLLPLFLQEQQGLSPLHSGLIQAPGAIGTALILPLASRLYVRIGPRRMLLVGFFFSAIILAGFLFIDISTPGWYFVILMALRGAPFSFAMVASQTIIYGPLPSEKQGRASSIYNTGRQLAASFGVAIVATVLISRTGSYLHAALARAHLTQPTPAMLNHAAVLGYHDAYLVCLIFMLVPVVLAWFVNDAKAAETMERRVAATGAAARPAAVVSHD
jgi:EmrB/QacA subfamily drug resistance transporter